jgi:methionyl-tRNA formyltransferase
MAVLQDAGIDLAAVILADPESVSRDDPAAHEHLPVYRAPSPQETRRLLEGLRPDLILAACYPWRLSPRARAAARCGVMNIHPSLLPHGRGPDPVFWVYRQGARDTGVTVHLMDGGLDSGPILAQQRLAVPEKMNAVTLELHLFETGASMAASLVSPVLTGEAATVPQDDLAARYLPAPSAHDWIISPLLPAAWAWRFVQGVRPLQGPLTVHTRGQLLPVRRAIAWGEHGDPPGDLPAGAFPVRFRPGWVVFE